MARRCSALRHADSEINHMVNPEVKSRSWITIWSLSSAPTLKRSFISPLPCPEYFSSRERCGRSAAGHPLLNYRLRQWTRPWINWHVIFFFFSLRTFINDWGTLCSAATQCTLVLLPAFIQHRRHKQSDFFSSEKPNFTILLPELWVLLYWATKEDGTKSEIRLRTLKKHKQKIRA